MQIEAPISSVGLGKGDLQLTNHYLTHTNLLTMTWHRPSSSKVFDVA